MKCFIVRTFDTNKEILNHIYLALDDLKISWCDSFSENSISNNIKKSLVKSVKSSDFIIAVLTKNSASLFFELGVGTGLNKPIFLISEKEVNIPYALSDNLYIRLNENLYSNIMLPLKKFINSLYDEKPKVKKKKDYKINNYNDLLLELNNVCNIGNERDYEYFIDLFLSSLKNQYSASSESVWKEERFDYALWIDDLEGIISNPVLFDIKFGYIDNNIIEKSALRTSKYLNNSQLAFILYCDKDHKKDTFPIQSDVPVIAVDIETFIRKVNETNLAKAILFFRNSVAHGKEL